VAIAPAIRKAALSKGHFMPKAFLPLFKAHRAGSLAQAAGRLAILAAALIAAFPVAARAERPWLSTHYKDHPLAGTIWTADFKPATAEQVETAVLEANFVMLGEIHTNPDHHRMQAQMVEALVRAGRRPAVIWEMIPTSLQGELDRHRQSGAKDAGKLGKALKWTERGWPDWAMYQPIAEAALGANLPLFAGALDPEIIRAIGKSDPSQAKLILDLKLDQPIRPEIVDALAKEIEEGHCNMLPKTAVKPMIMVQRARDAQMALIMAATAPDRGAVLIAGSGHAREDWAVPTFIKQRLPNARIASVAFFEVAPERTTPADYVEAIAGLPAPYDFIFFTPKADLTDHCAEMAEHMAKKKK
jgi:uncharacterized iron-regulated protein